MNTQRYQEYKDSGVQWLGEIPGHWEKVKLKVFCKENKEKNKGNIESCVLSLSYGKVIIKQNINFGLVPDNYENYQIVNPGYIILRLTDLQNDHRSLRTGLVRNRGIITSAYVGLVLKDIDSEYTQLLLHTIDIMKVFYGMGGGLRQSMSYTDIANMYIPVPPLSEQRAIVSYLDSKCEKIDKMIDGKEKQIALLQELKQRTIADAVTRGLNPDAKMKTTNISWLEEIPEHWITRRLGSLFTGDVETNKDFEFKRAFKFNYGQLVAKNEVGDPEEYHDVYVKYSKIRLGDILVNGLNLNYDFVSQRVACAPSEGIITSAYIVCRPREGVNYEYYTFLLKSMDSMKLFHGMGTGIRLTLSYKEIKKQIVPVPPLSEQRAIVSYINERTEKIDTLTSKLQQEIESIKEYKQRLISDVVTGQIKVC